MILITKTTSQKLNEFQFWYVLILTIVIIGTLIGLLKWQEKQILKNFPNLGIIFIFIDLILSPFKSED